MEIANIGQVIEYKLDINHKGGSLDKWAGRTIGVEVADINHEEKHYCVYTPYGPDHIPFDKCTVITDPKVYCVKIGEGSYEDYIETDVFVTIDKSKAEIFEERFNKIVEREWDRYYPTRFRNRSFWFPKLIGYDIPEAFVTEIKLR